MERDVKGFHLTYFTDNQATYDICRKSYSTKSHLMSLVCDICLLELELICMIIVIHVPGKVIIVKGTDTLSQELLLYPRGGKGGISPIIPLSQPALTFFPLLKLCFILGEILNFRRNLRWGIRQIYPLEISRSSCTMILRYLSPTIAEKGFSCALQY